MGVPEIDIKQIKPGSNEYGELSQNEFAQTPYKNDFDEFED